MSVTRWEQGRADIDRLITQGRLERVAPNQQHAQVLLEQARKAVQSAAVLATTDDTITAFTAAYDAARKALTAILVNQGLRPGNGEGGHAVLREAVLAQLEPPNQPAVRAFGWMRQIRNSSAYPEPDGATATGREVSDAIEAAHAIIQVAAKVIPVMPVYGR